MTAYNQKTIEKLAASRLKKVMSGLLRAGDRTKYDQLLGQMRGSVNKGSANPLPMGTNFTQVYRRMQAPPTIPTKSLKLKDRLTGSMVDKLNDSKKLYDARKGVRVELQRGGDASFQSYIGNPSYNKTYRNLRKQMRSPRKNPAGRITSWASSSEYPGEARGVFAHELAEALDSVPTYKNIVGVSRLKPLNKQTSLVRRFLGGVGEFMRGLGKSKKAPTRLSLYPKGQGRENTLINNYLGHYSANPLLAERLHTGGRTLAFRYGNGMDLFFKPSYRIGSKEAERILRNVGNVGGYTPPPFGRAAGKANIQLEKRLGNGVGDIQEGINRLAKDHKDQRRYEGRRGNMMGDRNYIRF